MRSSTLFLPFLLPSLALSQAAPFSSLAAFNESLPACAQAVQNTVFAAALNMAPYGCAATMDPKPLVESTNATEVLCICTAAHVPLTAPLTGYYGQPAFEGVATAACTMSETDITKLLAQSDLFIELCMGVANGTYAGDLSSKNATQPPPAGKYSSRIKIRPWVTNIDNSSFNRKWSLVGVLPFVGGRSSYVGSGWIGVSRWEVWTS